MTDLPEQDMAAVAGLRAANRRLARLGVETVDLSYCEHGIGATCIAQVGRAAREVTVHGASGSVAAVDGLADKVEFMRRKAKHR